MDFKPFKIGKYLLLERLATGGMAEVYRAKASGAGGFEKQLAVKRILPTYSTNEEFRRMFEYEARLSSMLTHANIVQIYDFVKSGDTYLLAMEYVDGKNLRQFINKAKKVNITIPIEFSVYVINETCKGLEYAHKKKDDLNGRPLNIIHRDMSPQNIMLSYEGAVKIVDFGIAKAKDRVDETRSGVIKGKFGYMSPEQANGEAVDHRTDIFSTGIILFELLTGRRLFSAENDMATLKLIQGCVIPPPSRINPKIPSELEKILLRGLTKDLALRYQSAGAFHRSLQEFLNKYYPSYTQKEVQDVLQKAFAEEIEAEKRRFEQIYRQSIPFSQGDQPNKEQTNFDEIEDILDGEITKSEAGAQTAVTFASEEGMSEEEQEPSGEGVTNVDDMNEEEGRDEGTQVPGGPTRVEAVFIDEDAPPDDISFNTKVDIAPGEEEGEPAPRPNPKGQRPAAPRAMPPRVAKPSRPEPLPESPDDRMPLLHDEQESTNSPQRRGGKSYTATQNPMQDPSRVSSPSVRHNEPVSGTVSGQPTQRIEVAQPPRARETAPAPRHSESRITLMTPPEETSRRSSYVPDDEGYKTPKSRSMFSFVTFVALLVGTVYLYSLYLDKQVPLIIKLIARTPQSGTGQPTPSARSNPDIAAPDSPAAAVTPKVAADSSCALEVDSDPAGATVIVDGLEKGVTSAIISSPCNRSVNLTIKLDGYETVSDNVLLKDRMNKHYTTLKRLPAGALELTLNRNAKVYIDGKFIKEVKAQEKLDVQLRALKHYSVRFVNEIFGIDTTRDFFIPENTVLRKSIQLEEPTPTSTRGRRLQ